jgi:hypothetical protein
VLAGAGFRKGFEVAVGGRVFAEEPGERNQGQDEQDGGEEHAISEWRVLGTSVFGVSAGGNGCVQ